MTDLTEIILTAVASGGLMGGVTRFWVARKKTPVEVQNMAVTGAATTVQAALSVAAAETARADRAEAAVIERDKRIAALEARLDTLQQALNAAYEELHAIRDITTD